MGQSETSVLLVDGPYDGRTVVVDPIGPWLVAQFGSDGEVVYRVRYGEEPLTAEFEGFRQR